MFSCEICEISKKGFYRIPPVAASAHMELLCFDIWSIYQVNLNINILFWGQIFHFFASFQLIYCMATLGEVLIESSKYGIIKYLLSNIF